ncbi:hypothetical protein LINPERHAP2_LOCUS4599, partial [Linum perenne]
VWVLLPNFPLECYDGFNLTSIRNIIGKIIHIDRTTLNGCWGNYAQICVEIDISEKLKSMYRLWRRVRRVEYEGLHVICFNCGIYGHSKDACPHKLATKNEEEIIPKVRLFLIQCFKLT